MLWRNIKKERKGNDNNGELWPYHPSDCVGKRTSGDEEIVWVSGHLKYSYNQEIGHEVSTTASKKLVIVRL